MSTTPTPNEELLRRQRMKDHAPAMFALLDRMVHTEGADWLEFAAEAWAIVKAVKGQE